MRVRVRVCVRVRVSVYKCRKEKEKINAGRPDCPASEQSGSGIKKTNDAVTGPVQDQAKAVRHFFGPVPDCKY